MWPQKEKINAFEILSLVLLVSTGVVLVGLQLKTIGWPILLVGLFSLTLCRKKFAKDLLLIFISLAFLGLTRITTDISFAHIVEMGTVLILAVGIPYYVSRYIYKDYLVRFSFHHGRKWYKKEIYYIFGTALITYFLLPFYFNSTGAHLNWTVEPGTWNVIKLFIGTNVVGLWDELFFISTVLGILRRYLSFHWANLVQGILFTSFLYELGFTGWGFIMIFFFALIQGLVFRKTESLLYVITIHLTLDLILFLALLNLHHPSWPSIFVN